MDEYGNEKGYEKTPVNIDEEAKKILESKDVINMDEPKIGLGKVKSMVDREEKPTTIIEDIGWIRIPNEGLPSQGQFYPADTRITIRAASAAEIRQWSTIDEEDLLSLDDALNRIVDKCVKIQYTDGRGSFKDLKEIDRFYLVFAIREYTFKRGENNLNVTFKCTNCTKQDTLPIAKEMLSDFVPSEALQSRFIPEERCFHLRLQNSEDIRLYLPTLGVMTYIKGFIRQKSQSREEYDQAFLKWAPFLFPDWRILNDGNYHKKLQDSFSWSTDLISVVDWFVGEMEKTVNAELTTKCSSCGSEVTAPINFRGGVKSLFLISDIASKLL